MAKGRMFALKVVDSAEFLELPLQAQALYFHLGVRADDDGFVRNPLAIMRMLGARKKYFDVLLANNFVIKVSNGVIIQSHWLINNTIRKDRYTPTVYQEEFKKFEVINGVYRLIQSSDGIPSGNQADTKCIPSDNHKATNTHPQDKLSKDKLSKDKCSCTTTVKYIPSLEDIQTYINNNNYTFNAEYFYNYYKAKGWCIGSTPIVDFEALKAIMDNWQAREKPQPQPKADEQQELKWGEMF